jgi:hypothetical protein
VVNNLCYTVFMFFHIYLSMHYTVPDLLKIKFKFPSRGIFLYHAIIYYEFYTDLSEYTIFMNITFTYS